MERRKLGSTNQILEELEEAALQGGPRRHWDNLHRADNLAITQFRKLVVVKTRDLDLITWTEVGLGQAQHRPLGRFEL